MNEFERLNAFVDGELSASDAAALSTRIAGDPALAGDVARLRALKLQVAELHEAAPPFVFAQPAPKPSRAKTVWRLLPVAAAVCIACGVAWSTGSDRSPVADAVQLATDHTDERRVMARYDFMPMPQAAGARHIRGYQGARGCVLTIIEGTRADIEALQTAQAATQTYLWVEDDTVRLILAQNMDAERFAFLANVLSDLWQGGTRADETMLLAQAPNTAPCVG